jgi:ABC-2 type transport system ATP-binding protein/transposase
MLNVNLGDYAPEGSAVRIIDQMVDTLDTTEIESAYQVHSEAGRPPLHPKTLLKVALLALHFCRFSLRKMEADTETNLVYKWLSGAVVIDHSTMGYFLARFCREIVELFTQVVKICHAAGLLEFDLLAIDSVKIRANANYKQSKTIEGISKEEQKIRERLEELIGNPGQDAEAEEEEARSLRRRQEKLEEARETLKRRLAEKGQELTEEKKRELEKKEKINVTDLDAQIMEQANGERNPAHSISTGTDVGRDIVVEFRVNEGDNDVAALLPVIEGSREKTGQRHEEVEADAGFASMGNYEGLEADGQAALIPDRRMEVERRGECAKGEYDRSKFEYKEKGDSFVCPQGAVLEKAGTGQVNGRVVDRYENRKACLACPLREQCTKSRYRVLTRDRNEEVRDRMREKLNKKRGRERYKKRAHAAECGYGQVKGNLKFRQFMRRGREKVRMEAGLLFMLHNMMKLAAVA